MSAMSQSCQDPTPRRPRHHRLFGGPAWRATAEQREPRSPIPRGSSPRTLSYLALEPHQNLKAKGISQGLALEESMF